MQKIDNHIPLLVPGVQATDHHSHALGDRTQTRAVGDHEGRVETELPEWLQPFTEGLTWTSSKFDRRLFSRRGDTPASTSSFRASSSKSFFFHRAVRKHKLFTHFPKDPTCEVCRRTKASRAPCKRNLDAWADRV